MIPLNLTISGFLSYRDPVEIDFTNITLACIAGGNGAGKSSILDAITWALFGQARRRDDSLINIQSETAEVAFTFEYESNIYRTIRSNTRGKTTKLEFQIAATRDNPLENIPQSDVVHLGSGKITNWKTLTEHTLRATQIAVENTLRLDYETFVNAAFFLQGKADTFTQQRSGDRKRILASILGLEVWETYRERAVERRKSIEAEVVSLDGRLVEINNELAEEDERKLRLAELETDLARVTQTRFSQETILESYKQIAATLAERRKVVDNLFSQLESTQNRLDELGQRLESRQKERYIHTKILTRESEIKTEYQAWINTRDELVRWNEIADQFRVHEKRREDPRLLIETERARLIQELSTLKEKEISIRETQSSNVEHQTQIKNLEVVIDKIQLGIEKRKSTENELTLAMETLADAKAENPRLKAEMDDLKSRIDKLTETEGAACPLCGQPLKIEERESLVEELTVIGKAMGDKYRANRSLLEEADDRVKNLKMEVKRLFHLDDELLGKKDQLNRLNTQLEQNLSQKEEWENKGVKRLNEIALILEKNDFKPEARSVLAEIDVELKKIGYDAAAHDAVRRVEVEGRGSESDFSSLGLARAALKPLEDEISNLQSQIVSHQSEEKVLQTEHTQSAANLAAAEAQAPDIHQSQRDLLDIQERENQLRLEVGAARQKVMVLDDLKIRRGTFETERELLAQKMSQYKQLERAFGKDGVPALLIESALPQIENKANDILDRLSGGTMSVRFITQREYKDKSRDDMRETLDIEISDSAGIREYDMFSGGEAFRINFAIRLALSEVLAQRAGARLQTLVIDEGFGSQDEVGRQRLIETINTVKSDFAKILVITHIESMKEAFPTRIEVEKTPRGSVVNVL
jgi:exonuclease SbcC